MSDERDWEKYVTTCPKCGHLMWRTKPCATCIAIKTDSERS